MLHHARLSFDEGIVYGGANVRFSADASNSEGKP
jgi:hypothetical protein